MVREWQEKAEEKAEKFGRMQQQIQQISVTESSKDGAVQVTVGSGGMLEALQLSEAASNRPMAKLGAEIMRTVQAAQAKIPEMMQQAVADTVGLEDTAAQHVLGQARKYFPEPPEDEQEPERAGHLREMQVSIEDDYEEPQRRQPPTPPQRPAAPPREQQPPTRRRPADDFDDDDFGSGSFLR
ncbi:YbaB/EbfC family nucleoid-associated protein [Saccharopolyspora sp. NPDC002686]|uniref:YbaB/EbfC family nucleoid-associated protein n=1 Tax=Saccharopolyspora sp. NPDC002686 TaxID=3154541 RepID=UPI00332D4EEF